MIKYEDLGQLNAPLFGNYRKKFDKILESGWYILGNAVKEFEQNFAIYNGNKYCVGVASGLDALILGLSVFNFKDGEVIVPSNTYIATILAIIRAGLKPVLVEPDIETYNIDPNLINEAITPRTKAILPVHLYGKSANMKPIVEIANDHDLKIIEDCAQAHGAKYKDIQTGTGGDIGAFSYYPTKNLGALGDAGAIVTDNQELYDKLKILRNYGQEIKYRNKYLGYNSRLQEFQAGFLIEKLKILPKITKHKRRLASIYDEMLTERIIKPKIEKDYFDVYHIYNIRTDERDELKDYLMINGVQTLIHYPVPPHKQEALSHLSLSSKDYPLSEEIHRTTLSLPISYIHTPEDIKQICNLINSFNFS